jgi:hypothetical protein
MYEQRKRPGWLRETGGFIAIMLIVLVLFLALLILSPFIGFFMLCAWAANKAINRPVTCPQCIVGVLHKNEYSDRVFTYECGNCDYSRLLSDREK